MLWRHLFYEHHSAVLIRICQLYSDRNPLNYFWHWFDPGVVSHRYRYFQVSWHWPGSVAPILSYTFRLFDTDAQNWPGTSILAEFVSKGSRWLHPSHSSKKTLQWQKKYVHHHHEALAALGPDCQAMYNGKTLNYICSACVKVLN